MLETIKEEMQINPRIISNNERAQFLNSKQIIKWMKKDGCEFDFEKAIFDFFQVFVLRMFFLKNFQREEDNLGSVDAKVFPNEDNEFIIKFWNRLNCKMQNLRTLNFFLDKNNKLKVDYGFCLSSLEIRFY